MPLPGCKEVASPAGNTTSTDTKAGAPKLEAPKMPVSEVPHSDFAGKPSALGIFERMPLGFYEPIDKAFESAALKNIADIREKSQRRAGTLAVNGTFGRLGISREEAEVLFSYTYEAKNHDDSPYRGIHKALAERDDNALYNYRGYILHLLKALRRLRPVNPREVTLYRGIKGEFVKFKKEHYKEGSTMTWPAFTSTTTNEDVAYKFMEKSTLPIIFEIHGAFVGYSIKEFSKHSNEDEILLEPEITFRIDSVQNDARNPKAKRVIVTVQQRPPIIKEAVENFARAERNFFNPQQQQMLYNLSMSMSNNNGGGGGGSSSSQSASISISLSSSGSYSSDSPISMSNSQAHLNPQQPQPQPQFNNYALPPNWVQVTDPKTGLTSYMNVITKQTQWMVPIF